MCVVSGSRNDARELILILCGLLVLCLITGVVYLSSDLEILIGEGADKVPSEKESILPLLCPNEILALAQLRLIQDALDLSLQDLPKMGRTSSSSLSDSPHSEL